MSIQYLIISTYEERLNGVKDVGELLTFPVLWILLSDLPLDRRFQSTDQPFSTNMQEQYIAAWQSIFPNTQTAFEPTVEGALNMAKSLDQGLGTQTLITGSLYLVGAALRILEPNV